MSENYKLAIDLGDTFLGSSSPFTKLGGIPKLVSLGAANALSVAGVLLIITIIIAGIQMITASGDTQQFIRARTILTVAITGFIIVFGSWFVVRAIETSTGAGILGG